MKTQKDCEHQDCQKVVSKSYKGYELCYEHYVEFMYLQKCMMTLHQKMKINE